MATLPVSGLRCNDSYDSSVLTISIIRSYHRPHLRPHYGSNGQTGDIGGGKNRINQAVSHITMLTSQIASARRSHSSSVRIGVRNDSSLVLGAGAMWVKGGEAVNRPGDIPPGEEEEVLITRDRHGNHGTLSFSLGTSPLLMTVMWTSGINCDHYANTLAVGVSSNQNTDKFK